VLLPAYQNEGLHITLAAHFPGNGGSTQMSSAHQIQTAPWLGFQ